MYDVSKDIISGSRIQIVLGIAALGSALAVPLLAPILCPAAEILITEGICDIAFDLLSQGNFQFDRKQYLKGKAISYAISLATFGLSAIASSLKIMNKAINICRRMAKALKECERLRSVCSKLAVLFEKLGSYLSNVMHLAKL